MTDNGSGGCNSLTSFQISSGGIPVTLANISTVGLGTFVMGWQSVLSNSSSVSAVTLATAPAAGDYEIHFNLDLHTPCSTGNELLSLSFGWTGNSARVTQTGSVSLGATQTTTSYISGVQPIHVASGNVTYTPTLTGSCATGTATWDGNVYLTRAN